MTVSAGVPETAGQSPENLQLLSHTIMVSKVYTSSFPVKLKQAASSGNKGETKPPGWLAMKIHTSHIH